ncbi:MAG TPA: circadian clock protein KaiC [Syntrophales bacterium]|nr:circadian clock protein KaiC [Syntrophales bacterium]
MAKRAREASLEKCPTGIRGFDEISSGGLPKGRPTLVCGSAGCGKTVLAMEFLLRGAIQFKEPGVFVSFEETPKDLTQNFASLGYDLNDLIARKLIAMDHIYIERSEIEETGEYDLEGLFIRLAHAIDSINAKRIVLDTIESLFSGLSNEGILRAELRRLFHWLKDRGITAVITGESGEKSLTRYGLEEYVADCVILLDFRVSEQISTRRLRIIKYRGSSHGADEYPFLIEKTGISILPVTSLGLEHTVSRERISSGIPRLDNMLAGRGFYRGSTILISGTAGTGKTSFASKFAEAACRRGERCLYLAFEESADQIIRNMKSIGTDLAPWVKKGRLKFHASRPSLYGLEMHLVTIHNLITEFQPRIVIVDPVSNLTAVGTSVEVKSVLTRLFDYLKLNHITTLLTDLVHFGNNLESTNEEISSLIDTWVLLRDIEINGERNRGLYILKSRGMAHSNQIREVLLSNRGIELVDVYLGAGGVLTGSARAAQAAKEKTEARAYQHEEDRIMREHEHKRKILEAKIGALRAEFDMESEELRFMAEDQKKRRNGLIAEQAEMACLRKADRSTVLGKREKGRM